MKEEESIETRVASLKATVCYLQSIGDEKVLEQFKKLLNPMFAIIVQSLTANEDLGRQALEKFVDLTQMHPLFLPHLPRRILVLAQVLLELLQFLSRVFEVLVLFFAELLVLQQLIVRRPQVFATLFVFTPNFLNGILKLLFHFRRVPLEDANVELLLRDCHLQIPMRVNFSALRSELRLHLDLRIAAGQSKCIYTYVI